MYSHWEIYDKEKLYLTKDGGIYSYEEFIKKYPAVLHTKMAVFCYENVIEKAEVFSYLLGINRISNTYTDEEALNILSNMEEEKTTESTPIERIAAAFEFIELLLMQQENNT